MRVYTAHEVSHNLFEMIIHTVAIPYSYNVSRTITFVFFMNGLLHEIGMCINVITVATSLLRENKIVSMFR